MKLQIFSMLIHWLSSCIHECVLWIKRAFIVSLHFLFACHFFLLSWYLSVLHLTNDNIDEISIDETKNYYRIFWSQKTNRQLTVTVFCRFLFQNQSQNLLFLTTMQPTKCSEFRFVSFTLFLQMIKSFVQMRDSCNRHKKCSLMQFYKFWCRNSILHAFH